jgi:hypothetical protein
MATRRLRQAAATTFGWIVVFDALHVYWELGGRFGFGDQADPLPSAETAWQRVFAAVVLALFVVGTVLPLAFVQRWGRRIPRRILITMAWVAAGLLTVRAVAAFVDDAMRTVFGSPTGLTGLTYEQLLGTAAPSAHTLWSARTIDLYFLVGGVLYGATAWYARRRAHGQPDSPEPKRYLSENWLRSTRAARKASAVGPQNDVVRHAREHTRRSCVGRSACQDHVHGSAATRTLHSVTVRWCGRRTRVRRFGHPASLGRRAVPRGPARTTTIGDQSDAPHADSEDRASRIVYDVDRVAATADEALPPLDHEAQCGTCADDRDGSMPQQRGY